MVVDAYHGIGVLLAQGAYQIVGTLLHLRIGSLDGIQLNTIAVPACVNTRYGTTAQSDTVVVATDYHHLVTLLGLFLQTVALGTVAYAAGQHDHLVIGILGVVGFLVLKGQHTAANQWLSELVAKVGGTVRGLYQYLLRRLVQPFAYGHDVLPIPRSGSRFSL